jgi:hypothetical protein
MNDKALVLAYIITVFLDKGIPALVNIFNKWKTEDPTLSDWKTLKTLIRKPSLEDANP